MKPNKNMKYNKFQNYRSNKMIFLDNGMIGWDGENFYRMSPSKKILGNPVPQHWVNQHVKNELEHILYGRR